MSDPPAVIAERIAARRAELGRNGVELEALAAPFDIDESTTAALVVGVVPATHADAVAALADLRERASWLRLRIIDEDRPLRPDSSLGRALDRVARRESRSTVTRDLVAAVRGAGWTIVAIERINPEPNSDVLWVDLEAVDRTSGEGDRDQRGE